MATSKPGNDRKEQIVSAAISRLHAVGFEGFRVGDVAKDVGINNATLIHHYPSKGALIRAVVERFTLRFEAVAEAVNTGGGAREKLARHMQASVELMRGAPEMFDVLNEIMIRARRDDEMAQMVSIPLLAWRRHIVSLLSPTALARGAASGDEAEALATACMAQLLGTGLLLSATDRARAPFQSIIGRTASMAIAALVKTVEEPS